VSAKSAPDGSIAVVLGTRPEIIKLGILIRLLGPAAQVIHTGQHYDAGLSRVFFEAFGITEPAATLGVGGESRGIQIGQAVTALSRRFAAHPPRAVVVQGDTNSAAAGALAANAAEIPLIHVEAGLRSHDRRMPEEHNRIVADHLADVCCAPTVLNRDNLLTEGIPAERIALTGNPIVEAVLELLPARETRMRLVAEHGVEPGRFILSTFHRPENVDDPVTLRIVLDVLEALPYPVVLPLHPRTAARAAAARIAIGANVRVTEPVDYPTFLGLAAESALLVADSGGIQEEATIVKRPVVVVRRSTERPEVIGTFATLLPPGPEITRTVATIVADLERWHTRLAALPSPYGDGAASQRIAAVITDRFGD
jgi:UDP-N-acetylglucosamine 2-epimerase (non-hydrolysing)